MMFDWNTEITVWDKLRDELSGDGNSNYWALWCAHDDLNSDSILYNKCYNTLSGLIGESETQNVLLQSYISSYIIPETEIPLTFTALQDNCGVKLTTSTTNISTDKIYYKTNTNEKWQSYTINTVINLNNGDSVQFKDQNIVSTLVRDQYTPINVIFNENYRQFVLTGKIAANGNVMSMHGWAAQDVTQMETSCAAGCFYRLFKNCTTLITPPVLPATGLYDACYSGMFENCDNLLQTPELPATILSFNCYYNMFNGCSSLSSAPELPATGLAKGCYKYMFANCSNLLQTPEELPATELYHSCYKYMFANCSNLLQAPEELPATILSSNCYEGMFNRCSSLSSAPELPATELASGCYNSMFANCFNLLQTPEELPAAELYHSCYKQMFSNCSSLLEAPELPATGLAIGCYYSMFNGCSSLSSAPELPATELYDSCYAQMFSNCSSLLEAPEELPATTLIYRCYNNMFSGCSSLSSAPELPATTLEPGCYSYMFANCSNLKQIKVNFTDWRTTATDYWLHNVSATGTFIKPSKLAVYKGVSYIPSRWTIVNIEESTGETESETPTEQVIEPGTESTNADLVDDEIEE